MAECANVKEIRFACVLDYHGHLGIVDRDNKEVRLRDRFFSVNLDLRPSAECLS